MWILYGLLLLAEFCWLIWQISKTAITLLYALVLEVRCTLYSGGCLWLSMCTMCFISVITGHCKVLLFGDRYTNRFSILMSGILLLCFWLQHKLHLCFFYTSSLLVLLSEKSDSFASRFLLLEARTHLERCWSVYPCIAVLPSVFWEGYCCGSHPMSASYFKQVNLPYLSWFKQSHYSADHHAEVKKRAFRYFVLEMTRLQI